MCCRGIYQSVNHEYLRTNTSIYSYFMRCINNTISASVQTQHHHPPPPPNKNVELALN